MTWTPEDAAHLLRRAGFGGTLEDVDRLHALGKAGAIDAIVDYEKTADAVWSNDNPFGLSDVLDEWDGVRTALLWQMLKSRRPLQAKLLWFWHGHFTTPTSSAGTLLFRRQMNTWRTYANGSFAAFLSAVYKDGAMLEYLNGSYSHKDRPNENFAREVQELYTTGTGPFREADVREAARALTGWEVTWPDRDVVFNPASFDGGAKTFLGQTGNFDGEDIMRILAQRPETARRTCAKLYRAFVSERVNLVEVNGLVKRWNETGGNIKAVMRAQFQLPSFWDVRTRGFLFKTPLELILGLMQRLKLDLDLDRARAVGWMSHQMGQDPFEPPNPAGYRSGLRLTGASMLLGRTQMAENLIFNWATPASIAILRAGLPRPTHPEQLIATVAARLGVTTLTAGTRASIATFLGSAPIAQANLEDRTRSVAFLVASSPEYQVM